MWLQVFDLAQTVQKEVGMSVADLNKYHKLYCEEEHVSYEARVKADEADRK